MEEDVLYDGFRFCDESSSLSEVGEKETRIDETDEGESNGLFAELSETVGAKGRIKSVYILSSNEVSLCRDALSKLIENARPRFFVSPRDSLIQRRIVETHANNASVPVIQRMTPLKRS